MRTSTLCFILLLSFLASCVMAQGEVIMDTDNLAINSTGASSDPSAILDVKSTSKGILIPRMTATQRLAIGSPVQGLMVYEIDTDAFWFYDGSSWAVVGSDNLGNHVATQNIAMGLNKITNLGFPTDAKDAARKGYVDNHVDGDSDPLNETITNVTLNGTTLEITEAGSLKSVDLDGLGSGGVFENNSGLVRNTGVHASDDFVFGRDALPPSTPITDNLFFFDKSKGALRAGGLSFENYWAEDSLGILSIALGRNSRATGDYSIALGNNSNAGNTQAIALGGSATGVGAVALGPGSNAKEIFSTASGFGTASGGYSFAACRFTKAIGSNSFAVGDLTESIGDDSFVSGKFSVAKGSVSTAMGYKSISKSPFSFTLGFENQTNAYSCFSIGRYCDTIIGVETIHTAGSPLFVIGNGLNIGMRNNAFVVTNDGTSHTEKNVFPMTDDFSNIGSLTLRFNEVYATNGTIQTSDLRAKKNVVSMSYGLEEILALETIEYNWNKEVVGEKKHLGVSAQQLLELIPEIVALPEDSKQLLGVKYAELTPVLIRAIQELHEEKVALQLEQDRLADRLTALEAAIDVKND